jgi:hypothetical protein
MIGNEARKVPSKRCLSRVVIFYDHRIDAALEMDTKFITVAAMP